MIVKQGDLIAGVKAPDCDTGGRICDYQLNLTTSGSDADDKPYLLTAIVVGTTEISIPNLDLRDTIAVEDYLNDSLDIGEFRVSIIEGNRTQIKSIENPNELKGIKYEVEAQGYELSFHDCGCDEQEGSDFNRRCDYSLYRKWEGDGEVSNAIALRFLGIEYPHISYRPDNPIDTEDVGSILQFLNSKIESEQKWQGQYVNETLTLFTKQTKYTPEKVLFEVAYNDLNGIPQSKTTETSFVAYGCNQPCPSFQCGGIGQPPCPNGQGNGCNGDLMIYDSLCRPKLAAGFNYLNGQVIAAGSIGQVPDVFGNCAGDLVSSNGGPCLPPTQRQIVRDVDLILKVNPNESFLSATIGNLGTFAPVTPILIGDTGADMLAWLQENVCPTGYSDCITLTVNDIAGSDLKEYRFHLLQVNMNFTNTSTPFKVTTEFCETEGYHSCVKPISSEPKDVAVYCAPGSTWDDSWCKCIEAASVHCLTEDEAISQNVVYYPNIPTDLDSYLAQEHESIIQTRMAQIRSTAFEDSQVRDYWSRRGIETDYRASAIIKAVAEGLLPDYYFPYFGGEQIEM